MGSNSVTRRILSGLVSVRRKYTILKPFADLLRGILSGLTAFDKNNEGLQPSLSMENLEHLLDWLKASGEYDEVVSNLRMWKEFLTSKSGTEIESFLLQIQNLAEWFTRVSLRKLGKYTENVNHFLKDVHPNYRWREDYHFTGIDRVEYHLDMLGSELLNCSLKADFVKSSHKIVILPPCMKAKPEEECLAIATSFGEKCMHCTPSCRINQITLLGEKHGFQVNIIPDDLKIFGGETGGSEKLKSVAVLGVSCPLTNAQGGLEMIHMGVPAQGLPLDYCGCTYHWHKDGIPTDVNIRELMRLLEHENDRIKPFIDRKPRLHRDMRLGTQIQATDRSQGQFYLL